MNDRDKFIHEKLDFISSQLHQLKTSVDNREEYLRCKVNIWLDQMREEWLDRLMEMIGDESEDEWWKQGEDPPFTT